MYPQDLKYTREHEWVKVSGKRAIVGITDHAQKELGDVVFVELPAVGDTVTQGGEFAVVESVKAVSEVYAPVSGTVIEVNQSLADQPELINQDPYGDGWIAVIELTDPMELDNLMSAEDYAAFVAGAEGEEGGGR
ncbi:MAG TPA: glycine cleavage system protein GcvH [Firmicutes bacterium]|nr:glycine cleavage system protein GcvH [Bacillota bacterium]